MERTSLRAGFAPALEGLHNPLLWWWNHAGTPTEIIGRDDLGNDVHAGCVPYARWG